MPSESDIAGLDRLFTNIEYSQYTVQVGAFSVDVLYSNAACTDHDLTGQIPWPGATILSHFIISEQGQALLKGKSVMELGSGVGICGLLASQLCQDVVLTDHNELVVDLLNQNVQLNPPSEESAHTKTLATVCYEWGAPWPHSHQQLKPEEGFDVILGSDIIYSCSTVPLIMKSVSSLLKKSGAFVLAYISRWKVVDDALKSELDSYKERGWRVESLDVHSLICEAKVPPHGFLYLVRPPD